MGRNLDMEFLSMLLEINTKEIGKEEKRMEKENLFMLQKLFMKEIGIKIKQMVKVK
jgi:hypothetical protein